MAEAIREAYDLLRDCRDAEAFNGHTNECTAPLNGDVTEDECSCGHLSALKRFDRVLAGLGTDHG